MSFFSNFNTLGSLATGLPVPNNAFQGAPAGGGASGDVSVAQKDIVLGRDSSGSGPAQEIPCTAQARALLDDATAVAQRATIGIPDGGQWVTLENHSDVDLTGLADTDVLCYDLAATMWKPCVVFAIGGIHCADASTVQPIALGASYVKVTAFTDNSPAINTTPDQADDRITLTKAGLYRVDGAFSFTSDTDNVEVRGTAFLDGVEQDEIQFARKIGTGVDVGNANFTGIIDVTTVPVDLDFRVRHDSDSEVNLTFTYANFNTQFAGPT